MPALQNLDKCQVRASEGAADTGDINHYVRSCHSGVVVVEQQVRMGTKRPTGGGERIGLNTSSCTSDTICRSD